MRIVSSFKSMPCAMHDYEVAKVAIAQNERIHRTHQSSAIDTSTHLPISAKDTLSRAQATSAHLSLPISRDALSTSAHLSLPISRDALSMLQAGLFPMDKPVTPCLPVLALDTYERRTGNKRPCEDFLQDAYEFKRRQCGLAAETGTNPSPGLEHLGGPPRKFGELEGSKIPNTCYQSGSLFTQEVNLNSSLRAASKLGHVATTGFDGRRTQNTGLILQEHSRKFLHTHLQQARMPLHCETMVDVGLHNYPLSKLRSDSASSDPLVIQEVINNRGNREKKCMWPNVSNTSSDSKSPISDIPFSLPTALAEKKTLASQQDDIVSNPSHAHRGKLSSPCLAQLGKQSSPGFSKPKSKVLVDVTNNFQLTATPDVKKHTEEDDTHRLGQRHKQIEFGKNTLGYERYLELVPKSKRKGKDPRTPNPKQVCSKRSWDGQIRKWRRLLHDYDPPAEDGEELAEDMILLKSQHKNDKPELEKDDIYPKTLLSGPQEITRFGATGGMATKDDGLSIYDDWMDC